MSSANINIDKAKKDKLFYFVANAVIYRSSDGRCLILKRSDKEKVHPGKYCVPGGKMEWGMLNLEEPSRVNGDVLDFEDVVEDLLIKETKEEAGISISRELKYINSVAFIRPDGIPVILVKFAVKYRGGDIRLEKDSFSDCAWVNEEEVKKFNCIDGIKEEVAETIEYFKQ